MLPQLAKAPFDDPAWTFEPKHDGYRMLVYRECERVRLVSRRGIDNTSEYPWLVELVQQISSYDEFLLDGEVVSIGADGRESFNLHQNRKTARARQEFVVFDLLYLDGLNAWKAPLHSRREGLQQVIPNVLGPLRREQYVPAQGVLFFDVCIAAGYEGVVAKRDVPYEPGRRSDNWLKFKKGNRDEFVVGGYTPGTGHRSKQFGALLLGYYADGADKLTYVGNVGTGFDDATLDRLLPILAGLHINSSPFDPRGPKPSAGARAPGPIQWLQPDLVADVAFQERTDEGILRFPSFQGLRDDKTPQEAGRGT